MMNIEFENSYLLILFVVIPLALMVLRVTLIDSPRLQLWCSGLIRCIIIALLICSLAGMLWVSQSRDVSLYVLADLSDSASSNAGEQAQTILADIKEQMPSNAKAGLITFASSCQTVSYLDAKPDFPQTLDRKVEGDQEYGSETYIESALLYAIHNMPSDTINRILLLSDGNETIGDTVAAAKRSAKHGFHIYSIPYQTDDKEEILLEDLIVPAEVKKGQSFSVTAVAHSVVETTAEFVLYRDGFKVQQQDFLLKLGRNTLAFQESKASEGLTKYELHVRSDHDFFADNNVSSGIVHISGEPRVLVLEGKERDARYIARALEAENIRVEVREGKGMPASLDEFAAYDAVIMSDVAAPEISVQQMNLLRSYVEDLGGGFVMIGGEESFGLGGYYRTSIEEMLPVRMRSEKKKDTPSLAMMLVIDKSGSMGGAKIELAKEAAIATVELLSERDYVGVIAFDGDSYWVVDLQSASNQLGIIQLIEQIDAGGGTSIYPGLVDASEALNMVQATFKHTILLTDGQSQPGDFQGIVNQMVDEMITVSSVAVGEGADVNLLEDIARWGNGRFYFTTDAYDIPQIFSKETMTASKSSLVEEPFLPQLFRNHQVVQAIDWEMAPFLYGYVVTTPKATADVILLTERGDPLLARWQYGLGKCFAFTSDAKSRWAADWVTWEGYSQFWAQVVRDVMRSSQSKGVETSIKYQGAKGQLIIDNYTDNGEFVNGLDSRMQIVKPDLEIESMTIKQSAPGRYEADFPLNQIGSYLFKVRQTWLSDSDGEEIVFADFTRGLTISYKPEYRHLSTNDDFLKELASVTGGKYKPEISDLFIVDPTETATVHRRLWRWFLAIALLLFVIDVALRRLDLAGYRIFRDSTKRYG